MKHAYQEHLKQTGFKFDLDYAIKYFYSIGVEGIVSIEWVGGNDFKIRRYGSSIYLTMTIE